MKLAENHESLPVFRLFYKNIVNPKEREVQYVKMAE